MILTALTFKKSDIFDGIYTLYLCKKRILEQTRQMLNTKFVYQEKLSKRQILALFCKLVTVIFVQKFLKGFRVM